MEDEELIRKYIRNQCSDDERQQVQKRLESDNSFKTLLEEERIVTVGIGLAERERLKQSLKKERGNKSYWYAAAAIVPLLILSYLFIKTDKDYKQLYADNYEVYGVYEFGQERGGEDSDELEISAFGAYKNGQFQKAFDELEKLYDKYGKDGYLLYQAVCLIELDRAKEVVTKVDRIAEGSNYYQIGQWYKALSLLNQERIEECREVLSALSKESGGLGNRATQLLDQL